MKVALIAGGDWLSEEAPALRRLTVGLVAEQVGVVTVVPQTRLSEADELATGHQAVGFAVSPWRWLRDRHFQQLAETLEPIDLDVLHVLDPTLERAAGQLAAELGLPMLCSVWRKQDAEKLSGPAGGPSTVYAAGTRGLAALCRRRLGPGGIVEVVEPGVYVGERAKPQPRPLTNPREALSVLVVGDGVADLHYEAFMQGMMRVQQKMRHAVYLFTAASDQHRLWQIGSKLGLLEQMSLTPGHAGIRPLLMQADLVVQPQPSGAVRTVVLEAMAAGRPVIATSDPLLDPLISHTTTVLLEQPTADQWAAVLLQTQEETHTFIEFGAAAKRHVEKHHRASTQVAATLELYRRLAGPQALPFGK